jgi:transposase
MQQKRLSAEYARILMDLKRLGLSNVEIAQKLGITEGAVRYRIKRHESGEEDGRRSRYSQLQLYHGIIRKWIEEYQEDTHRPTLKALHDMLQRHHGYRGSYDALRRYVSKHFSEFVKKGARTRIETPPGVLLQVDWKEDMPVQIREVDRWVKIQGLCFTLCFSRKTVVKVSESKKLEAFLSFHQGAFRRIGGLPQCIRPDCLRSAIVRWHGARSILNERYRKYIEELGIGVFPARPGVARDKGKVEKRIGDIFRRLELRRHIFRDLVELQDYIDREVERLGGEWTCGATGLSIQESFEYEKKHLRALPERFPELPLKEARTKVRRDGTVYFDGNYYQVPQVFIDRSVLCIHTGQEIRIYHGGEEIERFAHLPGTRGMVRLTEKALKDPALNLSEMVRGWAMEVARRQVEIYEELVAGRVS